MKQNIRLLLLLLTLTTALSLSIIPGKSNPVIMSRPSGSEFGYNITLSFSLPTNTIGLTYKQFIGVTFPKLLGSTDLLFDYTDPITNKPRFNCTLKDNENKEYTISPVASLSGSSEIQENNIAYCLLDDMINSPLKANI